MARIRKLAQTNYTVIDNRIIRDESLSWKAKGVFAYLWSMPDDWEFYETEVMTHAKDGRDSLRSAIKELQDAHYMRRTRSRNEKGQVKTSDWELSDKPMLENPTQGKPTQDNPMQENPTLPSTNGLSTDLPSTDDTNDDDEGNTQPIDPIKKSWTQVWENDPNQVVGTQLREWSQTIGPDLVCYAITVAGEHSVKVSGALKYLSKVISGWQDRQVTTLEQAEQLAAEHDKQQRHHSKRSRKARKEITPSWMNEDGTIKTGQKSKDTLTGEQRKKLDEMLAHMDKGGDAVGA
ncbi:DnaD domain protein [Lactiplantibacillus plantarum]|uniref:DnaD domain-containing protein n=1 Tax=Lactiplantibacillus plantarum TaxID=1590 RepID=UPI003C2DF334